MRERFTYRKLSMVNIALLATHQVDASYQKEWELFGVPGGITFFLFFNFFAFLPLLHAGIETTVEGSHHRYWLYVIPLTGLLTCILHAAFVAFGRSEFTQPLSLLILGTLLVSSSLQLLLARHL
jgi:hypothetical protein